MRFVQSSMCLVALVALTQMTGAQDAANPVADGGIKVSGWEGKIDASEEKAGQTLNGAKLVKEGDMLHVTTGPAVTY